MYWKVLVRPDLQGKSCIKGTLMLKGEMNITISSNDKTLWIMIGRGG